MKSLAMVGFMGSGKTTTAQQLLKHFSNARLVSLDKEVEKNENKPIKDIFKDSGENYFREIEHRLLNQWVKVEDCILDLGGGTFINKKNRDILKENNVITIFLDLPFNALCERLEKDRESRPLLCKTDWRDNAKNLIDIRYELYKMADIHIKIDIGDTVDEVTNKVIKGLDNAEN